MEPKVIQYLKRIVKTIVVGLIWMAINTKIGILNNYAFFEKTPAISNIVFYVWFITSLFFMLFYFFKIWKNDLHFEEEDMPTEQNAD